MSTTEYGPTNPIARAAFRTAELIHTVKVLLLVLNALAAVLFVILGAVARPGTATEMNYGTGLYESSATGSSLWFVFVVQGIGLAIVGTLTILVVGGLAEHMLKTNAEQTRILADREERERIAASYTVRHPNTPPQP